MPVTPAPAAETPRSSPARRPLAVALALTLLAPAVAAEDGQPLAPPAPPGFDYGALEAEVVREVQALRRAPAAWADHLEARRVDYDGDVRREPDGIDLLVEEGVAALDEAVSVLRATGRLPRVAPSPALVRAARVHARDLDAHDATGHEGSDGSQPHERIARFARLEGLTAENITFGPRTGREVVMGLVIDDGVPDRGHREILLTPELVQIGVACGPHPGYGVVCVMNLASGLVAAPSDRGTPAIDGAPPIGTTAPAWGPPEVVAPREHHPTESARPEPARTEPPPPWGVAVAEPHSDGWRPIRRPLGRAREGARGCDARWRGGR
jgi:hypothetical protein